VVHLNVIADGKNGGATAMTKEADIVTARLRNSGTEEPRRRSNRDAF
jgi:hypothetical protein